MTEFSITDILQCAVRCQASDIHLSAGSFPILRIDGALSPVPGYPALSEDDVLTVIDSLVTDSQKTRFIEDRELDFSFGLDNSEGPEQRFRANLFFEKGRPAAAVRIITGAVRTMKDLSLPEGLKNIIKKKSGLFLVTGPTGSGKSTTLAAMIQEINMSRAVHIITIEDPIEYIYKSELSLIHQREVGADTSSFAQALRRAMREDPDVIMIGELRDLETISAAVTAAETGHLVLATLHTRDAAQSIDRIVDVFPPYQQQQTRIQLSSALLGVLSQQLVPLASSSGRTAASEFLIITNAAANYVREGRTSQIRNVIQTGAGMGMQTMDQDLARLCQSGVITRAAAAAHSHDIDSFERYLA